MIGRTIAHYEITEKIGQGGMGEVYRATDTKLKRDVALKVLPETFTQDPQRMARFTREAQVLASLNHPNIGAIHGLEEEDGIRALVLELIEGEDLSERIAKGQIPLEEALKIALQIAGALEAAHEKGIIHRDLKPANVKITTEGQVKVLDFGLAKAMEEAPASSPEMTQSPTLTATQAGMILGTAAYMSPEQARGKNADARSDIWGFGVILFEMLSGRKTFQGEDITLTLASVVKEEPAWDLLPSEAGLLKRVLARCLAKEPRRRFHHIADARIAIEEVVSQPAAIDRQPRSAPPAIWLPWTVAALLAILAGFLGWRLTRSELTTQEVVRFSTTLPEGERLNDQYLNLVLSPDGSHLVAAGRKGLYRRPLSLPEFALIPGSEGGRDPFFSPDGEWIGFNVNGQLKRVPLMGGSPVTICESPWGAGTWGENGSIIFTQDYKSGLKRVSSNGGTPEILTTPNSSDQVLGHWWPQFLPGDNAVLFTKYRSPLERSQISLLFLETGEQRDLVDGGFFARYVPSGHLLYMRSRTLVAAPFSLQRLELTGEGVPVLENVSLYPLTGAAHVSVSDSGILAYALEPENKELLWVDRLGEEKRVGVAEGNYINPRLSPDKKRVSVTIEAQNADIWIYDLARGTLTRSTSEPNYEFDGLWTLDSKSIIFHRETPQFDLYRAQAGMVTEPEMLMTSPYDKHATSISPDGKSLLYFIRTIDTLSDIWLFRLDSGDGQPESFINTPFDEENAVFSPDGHWVAYNSDESGRPEVYLQPVSASGRRVQVSSEGGTEPRWTRGGRELVFRNGNAVMAVPADLESGRVGDPSALFDGPYDNDINGSSWDADPYGSRFLLVRTPGLSLREIHLQLNWLEELKRLVPTDN